MIRLMDKLGIIEIEMCEGDGCDFSADFFNVGGLKMDEQKDAYIVPDVDYCIE